MDLLFVSIAFPPKTDPECLQTARYFQGLLNQDLNIQVITSSIPTLNMPEDPALKVYDKGWQRKYNVPIFENKYLNFLGRKIIPNGIDYPDSKFTFYWQWKKFVNKIDPVPDIVYSRSFPLSSAFMAYKLSNYLEKPWIMHLSDPWTLSPLHNYTLSQMSWNNKWESEFIKKAAKVCFTSEKTVALYEKKYPRFKSKFNVFPNVYEKRERVNEVKAGQKLRIVYTGGLVGKRSAQPFLNALEKVKEDNFSKSLEVLFAGQMDRENIATMENSKLPFVKHLGNLSYDKALELQKTAHILLLIDNPIQDSEKAVYFPSKLLDYMTAQRRIWAITTRGGTTWEVMQEVKGETFGHDNAADMVVALKNAFQKWKSFDMNFFFTAAPPEKYESNFNAKRLGDLMKSII